MTGGQASLSLDGDGDSVGAQALKAELVDRDGLKLVVPSASAEELAAHQEMIKALAAQREAPTLWERMDSEDSQ